jgi:hypothetical protein
MENKPAPLISNRACYLAVGLMLTVVLTLYLICRTGL